MRACEKIRIAFLTPLLSRKAGGLFVCVRQLAQELASRPNILIRVFGPVDEYSEEDRSAWEGVEIECATVWGPKTFGYMPRLVSAIERFSPDIVHVHSMWTYTSKAATVYCARAGIPYIISPQGCLDPWALKNSNWKKWVALRAYAQAHLQGATVMHALARGERQSFRRFGLRGPVAEIPNGIRLPSGEAPPAPEWLARILETKRVLLYLGRLHPKKGLVNLIQAFGEATRVDGRAREWHLVIAGWEEGAYRTRMKEEVERIGSRAGITIAGPLFGKEKTAAFNSADAFILPSYSEGLPLAVLEAWSWRLPTLITAACNLDLAVERGAAVKIDNDPVELTMQLRNFFELTPAGRERIGEAAHTLVKENFNWKDVADDMTAVYRWAINPQGAVPGCIFKE